LKGMNGAIEGANHISAESRRSSMKMEYLFDW